MVWNPRHQEGAGSGRSERVGPSAAPRRTFSELWDPEVGAPNEGRAHEAPRESAGPGRVTRDLGGPHGVGSREDVLFRRGHSFPQWIRQSEPATTGRRNKCLSTQH